MGVAKMFIQIDDQLQIGTICALDSLVDGCFVCNQLILCVEFFVALPYFACEQDNAILCRLVAD